MKKILVASLASICLLSACSDTADKSNADDGSDAVAKADASNVAPETPLPEPVEPSEFSRNLDRGIKDGWTKSFVANCVTEAVAAGAPEQVVRPICECSSSEVLARLNDLEEFAQPPKQKMMDALQVCVSRSK
ncbi:hypothetical protein [Parasphingorhabdus sp.]|uniref:hypothetical protein n=1 Tax=Parasphingorhabdus sp. TaxID=2709688 RepID=UPI0032639184